MDFFQAYLAEGQVSVPRMILKHYHELGMDAEELVFWLELYAYQEKGAYPDLNQVAQSMGITQTRVFQLLAQADQKQHLRLVTQKDAQGKQTDTYDFWPLFEKLTKLYQQQAQTKSAQATADKVSNLYKTFEQEFGRPLSPLEFERIAGWLNEDHYDPELIRLALKEAVTHQARNLSYIDRILLNWESKNIRNKEEVAQEQSRRKLQIMQKAADKPGSQAQDDSLPPVTLHNPFKED